MATAEEIAALRLLIGEPEDAEPWTDETLAAIIDATETMSQAAGQVWTSKAASYSSLVDVAESGSSRKLGDLHKNALAMSKHFAEAEAATVVPVNTGPVIQRIRRSFT